jgi:hypothetical protein
MSQPITTYHGPISTFGGPQDTGVAHDEGLALIEWNDLDEWWFRYLFNFRLDKHFGLARNLNPEAFYVACRWDYNVTSRELLRRCFVTLTGIKSPHTIFARPADWGPNARIKRTIDMSPGCAAKLKLATGDFCRATLIIPQL